MRALIVGAMLCAASTVQALTLTADFSAEPSASILEGGSVRFTLSDIQPELGEIERGRVILFSGDGERKVFRYREGREYSAAFQYDEPGDYMARFVVRALVKAPTDPEALDDWSKLCEELVERARTRGSIPITVASVSPVPGPAIGLGLGPLVLGLFWLARRRSAPAAA